MSLEVDDFIENTRPHQLTLGDVVALRVGQQFEVVIWDRNFEEYWMWESAVPGQRYDPQTFFAANRWTVTYRGDLNWTLEQNATGEVNDSIHINTASLNTSWNWSPLKDGYVNISNEEVSSGFSLAGLSPKNIHWTRFPDQTRVGWRGPMMRWEKLATMPNVYYDPKHAK